jgi:hypothetical protein
MPDGTEPFAPDPIDAPASRAGGEAGARPLAERQIEALGELVGIGLKIARAIEAQVDEAGAGPQAMAELNAAAIAYARVARAVRQSIMLQSRLSEAQAARTAKARDLRGRVSRIVRHAIEDEHDDAEQVERLAGEAAERLEQERDDDVLMRPIREIAADICRDLGLSPDWSGLAREIAAAEALARGEAGEAAAELEEDEPEYVDVCWMGPDGPYPVARMRTRPPRGPYDPSKDPELRRDSS